MEKGCQGWRKENVKRKEEEGCLFFPVLPVKGGKVDGDERNV